MNFFGLVCILVVFAAILAFMRIRRVVPSCYFSPCPGEKGGHILTQKKRKKCARVVLGESDTAKARIFVEHEDKDSVVLAGSEDGTVCEKCRSSLTF